MYVVTGATGNTGHVVANRLLDQKRKVRAIGRSRNRLEPLAARGAEVIVADLNDQNALIKAFSGADAVYLMIPPNEKSQDPLADQRGTASSLTGALKQAQIKYAVQLSSIGADKESGTGPVAGLHEFEAMLDELPGLNVVHLRPGYFMENTLGEVAAVVKMGHMVGLLRSDLKMPIIATKDIGNRAADLLLDLNFNGKHTQELLGHSDLTMTEVAKTIGQSIGKPDLHYKQLPPEQVKPVLEQMGMSPAVADLIVEMSAALNTGHMRALEQRSARNTTPTSYESFTQEVLLPLYRQEQAA
ncbi:MAG TPA: NmrA family NAD(P)-binding protein [Candidatus Angelobacter sp.]|nr:NmrA family NAD(P)-binding protein [Candidatus Angelobacter sp.]